MSLLNDFLASIKEVKWFSVSGTLPDGCLIFDTWQDARMAARSATWEVARKADRPAVWDAPWEVARKVAAEADDGATEAYAWQDARRAVLGSRLGAVWDAPWFAVRGAARKASLDAAFLAGFIASWNNPSEPNTVYALKRWSVWTAGFGLLCDIKGTLYCYRGVA